MTLRRKLLLLIFGTAFILPSCGPLKPSLIVPNVQAGATNQQTIGQTKNTTIVRPRAARDVVQNDTHTQLRADVIERVEINKPNWPLIAAIVALLYIFWRLPTPDQMRQWLYDKVGLGWRKLRRN